MKTRIRSRCVAFTLLTALGCNAYRSQDQMALASQTVSLTASKEMVNESETTSLPAPAPAASAAVFAPNQLPAADKSGQNTAQNAAPRATDRLLIYTANLSVRVTKQEDALRTCQDLAQKIGGYVLSLRGESIQIRVPSSEFFKVVDDIQALGTVVTHDVQAEDVSEQFHDLELRLKNARAVRDRLEQLLLKAVKISDALAIQDELANLSERIELMEGQLRRMGELVRYSTINASFQQREVEHHVEAHLTLPFAWLDGLSLQQLMEVKQ
jgi:hypothetical protein